MSSRDSQFEAGLSGMASQVTGVHIDASEHGDSHLKLRTKQPTSRGPVRTILREIAVKLLSRAPAKNCIPQQTLRSSVDLSDFLFEEYQALFSSERLCLTHRSTEECFVSVEQAQQVGLLVYEVLQNAIQHAHPSGIFVHVTLECRRLDDGRLSVCISDDGIGLPEHMNPYREGGKGLTMIRSLAKTLRAELRIDSDTLGSTFKVIFQTLAGPLAVQDESYFRKILDELSVAVYATDSLGHIVYFNEAAAELWGDRPELGSSLWSGPWKLFWSDGRPMQRNTDSPMALAIREKRPIRGLEAIIERPDGTRVRYLPSPTPLFNDEGELIGAVNLMADLSERARADELALRLAAIVESSDDAILSKSLDGEIITWNSGCERLFGYTSEEAIGRSITMLAPEDRPDEEPEILSRLSRGEKIDHYETVRRRKDGSLVDISLTVSPIRGSAGSVVGASSVARDISSRRRAIEQQNLLLGEMRHRVKNLAAVIDSLARQSCPRDEPAVETFVDGFVARIRALLSTGELTLASPARSVEIQRLLEKVLEPFIDPNGEKRIVFRGPRLVVSEQTAGGLGLAFHELATNALKYGALKAPDGRVAIEWSVQSAGGKSNVQIEWKESGGEPVTRDHSRRGFGSRVIGQALARERESKTELRFEQDGLRCRFEFTTDALLS